MNVSEKLNKAFERLTEALQNGETNDHRDCYAAVLKQINHDLRTPIGVVEMDLFCLDLAIKEATKSMENNDPDATQKQFEEFVQIGNNMSAALKKINNILGGVDIYLRSSMPPR